MGAEPPPQFSAHFYCGRFGMEVGLSPGDLEVLDGDPAPLPKKGAEPPPQFSAHFYCGQTAVCTKMLLGMELGLSPGDFVFNGDPLPKRGRSPSPIFGPCLLRPNGLMDQDGTWHGGGPWSKPHCARWGPSSPPQQGGRPPIFSPFFIVAKRLDASRCHLVWRSASAQATLC